MTVQLRKFISEISYGQDNDRRQKVWIEGSYTAAVKFKEQSRNCNDAVVKIMEEGKVVSEAAHILFYKELQGYWKTTMSDRTFG